MKTILLSLFLLIGVLWMPVRGAVVISELSSIEADALKVGAVFHYTAQAGGTSGANSQESLLSTTSVMPDVSTDVTHSFPETLSLQTDIAGNLGATLGSGSTLNLPIVDSYNAILIQVYNYATVNEGASFDSGVISGVSFRNLYASNGPEIYVDQILIHLNGQSVWTLSGDISFDPADMISSNNRVEAWGVTIVPEPSTMFLFVLAFTSLLFFRNRR